MAAKRAEPRARGRPPNGAQGAKRALLVAVNHYGNPQNDLPSCLKDAAQFKAVLQSHYGFQDFTELYDADATAAKVALAGFCRTQRRLIGWCSSTPATAISNRETAISKNAWYSATSTSTSMTA
jgi:hypothetical protein